MFFKRYEKNPILTPDKDQSWEAEAVFNGSPIKYQNKIYLLYRALSTLNYQEEIKQTIKVSTIGLAKSQDGLNFSQRRKFIYPEKDWERFGCEDPRVSFLNNKYFIFYTALASWPPNSSNIKVGLATTFDFKKIEEKKLITPFNAKAMVLFPEKINNKIWAALTINTDQPPAYISLIYFNNEKDIYDQNYWLDWYKKFDQFILKLRRSESDHLEVGSQPIKTKYGWLLFYSYIRNYFSDNRVFTVEAVLLDLKNPLKILARTDYPIFWPEEYYEKYGISNNVVFPSGALLKNNKVWLYYGAADTNCSLAFIDLNLLVKKFLKKEISFVRLKRYEQNPIIEPNLNNTWERKATFNPAAIYLENKVYIIYRAMSEDNTSVFGYAVSSDGFKIDYKSNEPIYFPRESFETKLVENANSGVEDPRLVKINNLIYMFYTAYDGKNPPKVAFTSIKVSDFLKQNFKNWARPKIISPLNVDDKDAAMFPEKINGYYLLIHRVGNDIDLSFHKNLNFENEFLQDYRWFKPRIGYWDSEKIGLAFPPLKTKQGWLVFYHGVSSDKVYRVGAILADLKNPLKILARTDYPIFEPETNYEKFGLVNNVVFPCGAVLMKNKIFVYYGGADKVIGVATVDLNDVLKALKICKI